MKTALVITTINKPNKNINSFSLNSKKKKLEFYYYWRQKITQEI